ncbi:Sigma-70 region 2 [Syntrophaceticus schinkii]|uniref:Sigma-70 region 2 n=1 Tax=Syntrophaceticus schinkii TaxID=499207 RepID=A0A0B7MJM0_9FIRM|nr:Sigma-70 region 2 [Syntrophaceticus schinkii]
MYIKKISGNEQIAEDITSETFLKAMAAIDGFRGSCNIRVWLCQIAKNCYCSYLRKNGRLQTAELLPDIKDTTDIEALIISSEEMMKINQVLHELDEPYKEVFSLRVFGELSFKQIGALFNKSENWACVTYHRSRKKIQDAMEGNL